MTEFDNWNVNRQWNMNRLAYNMSDEIIWTEQILLT